MSHQTATTVEDQIPNAAVKLNSTAAIYLPSDVKNALRNAQEKETSELPKKVIGSMLKNLDIAESEGRPSCQDTGTIIFYVRAGDKFPYRGVISEGKNYYDEVRSRAKANLTESYKMMGIAT